jgi:deoxyribonuclease IV
MKTDKNVCPPHMKTDKNVCLPHMKTDKNVCPPHMETGRNACPPETDGDTLSSMPVFEKPILGAHKSIAGGFDKAVQRALESGCQCLQLFTKNNNQWRAKPIEPDEAARLRQAFAESSLAAAIAHDSYLINLASPDPVLWKKSVIALIDELRRAETLGLRYVVAHPGCFCDGNERSGLRRIIRALDSLHKETAGLGAECLLETTAGQGTSLGWRFEHLAAILDGVKQPERLGVCVDTCHIFAAGYPMAAADEYHATMEALDHAVGLGRIRAFHLNDSARDQGSRVDRHAHIGRGKMGLEPFRHLLADPRFRGVPMYLETPKGEDAGEDLDAVNLRTLRGLIEG